MDRLPVLTLFVLMFVWCQISADQTFSTRTPGDGDYGIDAEEEENEYDEGENVDSEPELTITAILGPPYMMQRSGEEELMKGPYEGIIPDIVEELCLQGYMTCDYELVLVRDGQYGARNIEGPSEWSGMIGEVSRQEADFAAAALSMTEERRSVVNFTVPWAAVSLTVLAREDLGITSLEDLLEKDIIYGGIAGGVIMERMRSLPEVPYSEMWSTIDSSSETRVATTQEGITRALNGTYAFIMEDQQAEYYAKKHCSLVTIPPFLQVEGYGFAFPKDSEYLEEINKGLTSLREDGTITKIHNDWYDVPCAASSLSAWTILVLTLGIVTLNIW